MKIKKLFSFSTAVVLSVSALLSLSVPMAAADNSTCQWNDSSGIDNNFSTAGNWLCSGSTPGNGGVYALVFPDTASGYQPVDNIANLSVSSITFQGSFSSGGYTIEWDPADAGHTDVMHLSGNITDNSTGNSVNEIDPIITLNSDITATAVDTSELQLGDTGADGNVNVNGHILTLGNAVINNSLTGSGTLSVDSTANGNVDLKHPDSFSGAVNVTQGTLFVDDASSLSSASAVTVASGAFLKGNGGVSSATIQSGGTVAPGHSPGCITASSMTINGTYNTEIGGTTACTEYDQLQVSNSVDVSNGTLQVSFVNGFGSSASVGQTFTIINNSGSNPVTGTFAGLPEGGTFTSGGVTFRISYQGGNGNDVVLTVVSPASAASLNTAVPKTPNTGLASFKARPGLTLGASVAATIALLAIAHRLKPLKG